MIDPEAPAVAASPATPVDGAAVFAVRARGAVVWTTAVQGLRDFIQFGLMLVMVRLLPLEAYGQFGLVSTILAFAMVFSSREFIAHTLLIRDAERVNYQEQFVAGLAIQGTLCVLVNALAVTLRWFPAYAPVAPLLHVMSLLLLVDLPSELRMRMIEREFDWRRLRTVEAIGVVAAAAVSIGLGLAGAGVYALLVPSFATPMAFLVDLFVVAGWRPTWTWHAGRYADSRVFGMTRVVSGGLVSAASLAENGILARAVGYAALGIFGRALSVANLFCLRIAFLLMAALYPLLARIEPGSRTYQRVSGLTLRAVIWLALPCAAVIALVAPALVHTLYGARWVDVIPLVPWAMAVGACLAALQAGYQLLLAHHGSRRCLAADVWRLAGVLLALAVALPHGVRTYLAALTVVYLVTLAIVLEGLHRSGGLRLRAVGDAVLPAGAGCLMGALAAEAARRLLLQTAPDPLLIIVYPIVFGAAYLAALRTMFPGLLRELIGYLPRRRRVERWLGFQEAA
jgi:O-antigen/teichoic acid export membrane protein